MSLKEADKLTPKIKLADLISSLEPADVKTERIIVMSPSYMSNLTDILSVTPSKTLQTYFVWKAIQAFAPYVEADELKPYKRFLNELQGKVCAETLKCANFSLTGCRTPTLALRERVLVWKTSMILLAGS